MNCQEAFLLVCISCIPKKSFHPRYDSGEFLIAGKPFIVQTRLLVESCCYRYVLLFDFWIVFINFVNDYVACWCFSVKKSGPSNYDSPCLSCCKRLAGSISPVVHMSAGFIFQSMCCQSPVSVYSSILATRFTTYTLYSLILTDLYLSVIYYSVSVEFVQYLMVLSGKLISFLMNWAIHTPTTAAFSSNLGSGIVLTVASSDFPIRKLGVNVPSLNTNFKMQQPNKLTQMHHCIYELDVLTHPCSSCYNILVHELGWCWTKSLTIFPIFSLRRY